MTTETTAHQSYSSQTVKAVSFLVLLGLGAIYFFVVQRNTPPEVSDLMIEVRENSVWSIDIVIKDSDLGRGGSSEEVRIKTLGTPSNGVIEIDPAIPADLYDDSTVVYLMYTPHPDFYGEDSFTYTAIDKRGNEAKATVHLTVTKSNERLARETREENQRLQEEAEALAVIEAEERRRIEAENRRRQKELEEIAEIERREYERANIFPLTLERESDFIDRVSRYAEKEVTPTALMLYDPFDDNSNNWIRSGISETKMTLEIKDGLLKLQGLDEKNEFGAQIQQSRALVNVGEGNAGYSSYWNFMAFYDLILTEPEDRPFLGFVMNETTYREESDYYYLRTMDYQTRHSIVFSRNYNPNYSVNRGDNFSVDIDISISEWPQRSRNLRPYDPGADSPKHFLKKNRIRIAVFDNVAISCINDYCKRFRQVPQLSGTNILGFYVYPESPPVYIDNLVVLDLPRNILKD